MERLTIKTKEGYERRSAKVKNQQLIDKLATYENLEEQGRLVILPCKVGDTVYKADVAHNKVFQHKVMRILKIEHVYFENYDYCLSHDFGETVFLTKEEAEQKIKEMESDLYENS